MSKYHLVHVKSGQLNNLGSMEAISGSWQEELANLIRTPEELAQVTDVDLNPLNISQKAWQQFPLRVTHAYAKRIVKGDLNDPLLRQILPVKAELEANPGYTEDPLQEKTANPVPGLIHKYPGRVLLITAPQCAIHCRYCFRRHFNYEDNTPSREQWQQALSYIQQDKTIEEVIYSGGDPLIMADKQLQWLTDNIAAISHVQRLRVHTRLPIVLPSRITPALIQAITKTHLQTTVVIHCNHANEIDMAVEASLAQLRQAGITLLNQSVLLAGVNDSSDSLADLSRKLFSAGVLPYYLHLLDKVIGAEHFLVTDTEAKTLSTELRNRLSGYLVPKLVREEPAAQSKIPII